jgi:shikimate 5-dehydrogenase
MRLALIGHPIEHSKSPDLYKKFLGSELQCYDLLSFPPGNALPSLVELAHRYDGLNITAPYKRSYFSEVTCLDSEILKIGAINTILLSPKKFIATNTDYLATQFLIKEQIEKYKNPFYILLGNGVMAKMTQVILDQFGLFYQNYFRKRDGDISQLDLSIFEDKSHQVIVVNTCSRDFVFSGKLNSKFIFWDFNYSFIPHLRSLPDKVSYYFDGFEMLERQAIAAIDFWKNNS